MRVGWSKKKFQENCCFDLQTQKTKERERGGGEVGKGVEVEGGEMRKCVKNIEA